MNDLNMDETTAREVGLRIDQNIVDAINLWIHYGILPGSCSELLLKGDYDEAFLHAHPLIKPYWDDHIKYVETLPLACRGEGMETWKGTKEIR